MSTEKGRRLSPKEWAEAGALWETGEFTLQELADKFGITKEALQRKFKRIGLSKGGASDAHAQAVRDEFVKSAAADAAISAQRIKDTKEQHYNWAAGLARMAMHEVAQAAKEGLPVAARLPNLKSIEKAMVIVQRAREERYAILGLDRDDFVDDDALPDLLIQELTAEEVVNIQQRRVDESLGIETEDDNVIIEGTEELE